MISTPAIIIWRQTLLKRITVQRLLLYCLIRLEKRIRILEGLELEGLPFLIPTTDILELNYIEWDTNHGICSWNNFFIHPWWSLNLLTEATWSKISFYILYYRIHDAINLHKIPWTNSFKTSQSISELSLYFTMRLETFPFFSCKYVISCLCAKNFDLCWSNIIEIDARLNSGTAFCAVRSYNTLQPLFIALVLQFFH